MQLERKRKATLLLLLIGFCITIGVNGEVTSSGVNAVATTRNVTNSTACNFRQTLPRYYSVNAKSRISNAINSVFINDDFIRALREQLAVAECQISITESQECTPEEALLPCLDPYYVCGQLTISPAIYEAVSSGLCASSPESTPLCDALSDRPEIQEAIKINTCRLSCIGDTTEVISRSSEGSKCYIFDITVDAGTKLVATGIEAALVNPATENVLLSALSAFDNGNMSLIIEEAKIIDTVGFGNFPPPPSPPPPSPPPPSPPPPPPPLVNLTGTTTGNDSLPIVDAATIVYGGWSECSAPCGPGFQTRTAVCTTAQGAILQLQQCGGLGVETTYQECSGPSCSDPHWEYSSWSQCSDSCNGGIATRSASCVGGPACPEPQEPLEVVCNSAPCDPHHWDIGAWSSCSSPCDGGFSTRTVRCITHTGQGAEPQSCPGTPPTQSQVCNAQPCDFCKDNSCSSHGTCEAGQGTCQCDSSLFGGSYCQVPSNCASGVVDSSMVCCNSGVVDIQGSCCPADSVLDGTGSCCASWAVDVCGLCGGEGKVVDMQGTCCPTVLDANGLCCMTGKVDDCGVCDGLGNTCSIVMSMELSVSSETVQGDAVLKEPLETFFKSVSADIGGDALNVTSLERVDSMRRRSLMMNSNERVPMEAGVAISTPTVSSSYVAAVLGTVVANQPADAPVLLSQVPVPGRVGVCGNGVCEIGERGQDGSCPGDCGPASVACPSGCVSGVCLPATGLCECFVGHTGSDCSLCSPGFMLDSRNGMSCIVDVMMLGVVTGNSANVVLPPPSSDSSNAPPSSSSSSSSDVGVILGSIFGALAAVALAAALFVYVKRRRRTGRDNFLTKFDNDAFATGGSGGDLESHGRVNISLRQKYDPTSSVYNSQEGPLGGSSFISGMQPTGATTAQYHPHSARGAQRPLQAPPGEGDSHIEGGTSFSNHHPAYHPAVPSSISVDALRGAVEALDEEERVEHIEALRAVVSAVEAETARTRNDALSSRLNDQLRQLSDVTGIAADSEGVLLSGRAARQLSVSGVERDSLSVRIESGFKGLIENAKATGLESPSGSSMLLSQSGTVDDDVDSVQMVQPLKDRPLVPRLPLNVLGHDERKRRGGGATPKKVPVLVEERPAEEDNNGGKIKAHNPNSVRHWEHTLSARGMVSPKSWREDAGLKRTDAAAALHTSQDGPVSSLFNTPRGQLLKALADEAKAAQVEKKAMKQPSYDSTLKKVDGALKKMSDEMSREKRPSTLSQLAKLAVGRSPSKRSSIWR